MPKTRIAIALAPETLERLDFEKALAEEGLGAEPGRVARLTRY